MPVTFWSSCVTRVPPEDLNSLCAVEGMRHELLAFLSESFKGSQLRWTVVDNEAFAVSSTFVRLPCMFGGGAAIVCDNRNLANMFHRKACTVAISKTLSSVCSGGARIWGNFHTRPCTSRATETVGATFYLHG